MNTWRVLWRSTVGKKAVMALTGIILFGWLLLHLGGNLLVFAGPAASPVPAIDRYGAALHERPWLLWPMRFFLLLAAGLHLAAAVPLARRARYARGTRSRSQSPQVADLAAHTMRAGGVLLACFIGFHILHFTTGTLHPAFVMGGVRHNLVSGLRVPAVAAIYLGAVTVLALHIGHGLYSARRSLGLTRPAAPAPRRLLSLAVALALWAGFGVIPLAVIGGVLR